MVSLGSKLADLANSEEPKIKNSKIKHLYVARLLFIKLDKSEVYNPLWIKILQILCTINFFPAWILKKLPSGVEGGSGGTLLISSWKCNY